MPAYDLLGELFTDVKTMIDAVCLASNGGTLSDVRIAPTIDSPEALELVLQEYTGQSDSGWLGLPALSISKATGPRVSNMDVTCQFGASFPTRRGIEERWAAARQTFSDLLQSLDLRRINLSGGAASAKVEFTSITDVSFSNSKETMILLATINFRVNGLSFNTPA